MEGHRIWVVPTVAAQLIETGGGRDWMCSLWVALVRFDLEILKNQFVYFYSVQFQY